MKTHPENDTESSVNVIATISGSGPYTWSFSNSTYGITVVKVEFKERWETSNRVNQVVNPAPKDDPPPTASNKLYVGWASSNAVKNASDYERAVAARDFGGALYMRIEEWAGEAKAAKPAEESIKRFMGFADWVTTSPG